MAGCFLLYYHSWGKDYKVVACAKCDTNMESIYSPAIRDKCTGCGGKGKGIKELELHQGGITGGH